MKEDLDKVKYQIEKGYYQPSLFEDDVVEAHSVQHFVVLVLHPDANGNAEIIQRAIR
jgi:hypothetical protein